MRRFLIPSAVVLFTAASAMSLAQCSKAPATPPASDYQLIGTVHDIMEGIVDPSSDVLFDAVATDITAAGVNEKFGVRLTDVVSHAQRVRNLGE